MKNVAHIVRETITWN